MMSLGITRTPHSAPARPRCRVGKGAEDWRPLTNSICSTLLLLVSQYHVDAAHPKQQQQQQQQCREGEGVV
ncbi:hypothetical protein B296_00055496 [Ensete ventricosum]|uniref:Uncharacterized protein n=1 Tax=Ensete ventricosum TaxID=4639 RepID=A0A426XSA6_ENSVE|nr:hypothetical protein B296_00055496 [Ensete ventricosum]